LLNITAAEMMAMDLLLFKVTICDLNVEASLEVTTVAIDFGAIIIKAAPLFTKEHNRFTRLI